MCPQIARKNVAAGTENALNGLKFSKIGSNGAFLTVYASTPTAAGSITFSAEGGDRALIDLGETNIEIAADVVDSGRDLMLLDEPVGPGDLFLAVNAQIGNFLVLIEEGPALVDVV